MLIFACFVLMGVVLVGVKTEETVIKSCFIREMFEVFAEEKVLWTETSRDVKVLKKKIETFKENYPSKAIGCKKRIAFYARITTSPTLSVKEKVKFDNVITDTCNTYNKSTGTFTCPATGVYVFNFFVLNSSKNRIALKLCKNVVVVAEAWADDRGGYETSGNSVILELTKGDQVYVAVSASGTVWNYYTTFSGYAL